MFQTLQLGEIVLNRLHLFEANSSKLAVILLTFIIRFCSIVLIAQ